MENKKRKKVATALKYDMGVDIAPQIIAKGIGIVAENIIGVAEDENIPVYQDKILANQLNNLKIGDHIPEDLYDVVAEVLIFIASVDNE